MSHMKFCAGYWTLILLAEQKSTEHTLNFSNVVYVILLKLTGFLLQLKIIFKEETASSGKRLAGNQGLLSRYR